MNTTANGVEHMTDFQFRAIIAMVLDKLDGVKNMEELEEAKKTLQKLSEGNTSIKKDRPEE